MKAKTNCSGFTLLELLVAVSVTALLAAMLLNITSQVVTTQTEASGDLETNQAAQFILDRVQEDLQCAVYRNDGEGNFEGCMYAEGLEHSPVAFGYLDSDDLIDFVSYDTCSFCGSEVFFSVHD